VLLIAIACSIITTAFVIGALLLVGILVEREYLKSFGAEARATETGSLIHIVEARHHVREPWRKINYSFPTTDGRTISASVDRPVDELALVPRAAFAVVYWSPRPSVTSRAT
jgi:hypothetical protein